MPSYATSEFLLVVVQGKCEKRKKTKKMSSRVICHGNLVKFCVRNTPISI